MSETYAEAATVFELLGNETRASILRTLADAYSEAPAEPWLSYTELREAAQIRDKGNFNYHLDRLDDLVVAEPEGYVLSRIGMALVSSLASGAFDPAWTWGPVEAPGDCLFCDRSVELRYEDGLLGLTCGVDDHELRLGAPPSLLATSPQDAVIDRIAFFEFQWSALTRQGICSECGGHVDGKIEAGGEPEHYHYHGHCDCCGFQHGIPVGTYVLSHPAVIQFFDEHGVDVRTTPFWTLDCCTPGRETVAATDPLRLHVDIEHEGETLSLTVSEDGAVVQIDAS